MRDPLPHPADGQLGEKLLAARVLFSLACNTVMVAHPDQVGTAICDPACCGWHWADLRTVATQYRRFDVPVTSEPDTVWVISATSQVPGIIHKRVPEPRNSPE